MDARFTEERFKSAGYTYSSSDGYLLILAVLATILIAIEISSSWFQAHLFSAIDRRVTFSLESGPRSASRNRAKDQQWLAARSHRFRQLRIWRFV